ncbi:MAG: pyridoxal phosphate-dependent aminotransferase [Deltaproteobacteria bacterium]
MKKDRFILGWSGGAESPSGARDFLSDRVKSVMQSPHGMWNYMTYRDAIAILGLNPAEIYRKGRTDLDPSEWADFGWMTCFAGPPRSAVSAMREATVAANINPYSPDLINPLRDACARKFGKDRGLDFEVVGTEGAQAAISYALQTFLNPADEVIITDPGYFHFEPAILIAGGAPVKIPLSRSNGYRLDPDELQSYITPRTRAVMVCDPVNPFGTVQTRGELIQIAAIARDREILIINDITHNTHQIDPSSRHYPMASLDADTDNVISTFSVSHGYGMAGVRIGFLAGRPELMRACLITKIALTRLNTNLIAQYGALAALGDDGYVEESEGLIRRNWARLKEIIARVPGLTIPVEPQYGFSAVIDVSGAGVTAQELTVALFNRKVAVYPGDGLGDVGAADYIRLNISRPDEWAFDRLNEALPLAVQEAMAGVYREGVINLFASKPTERARAIISKIRG